VLINVLEDAKKDQARNTDSKGATLGFDSCSCAARCRLNQQNPSKADSLRSTILCLLRPADIAAQGGKCSVSYGRAAVQNQWERLEAPFVGARIVEHLESLKTERGWSCQPLFDLSSKHAPLVCTQNVLGSVASQYH
jgi:hypothetical protein